MRKTFFTASLLCVAFVIACFLFSEWRLNRLKTSFPPVQTSRPSGIAPAPQWDPTNPLTVADTPVPVFQEDAARRKSDNPFANMSPAELAEQRALLNRGKALLRQAEENMDILAARDSELARLSKDIVAARQRLAKAEATLARMPYIDDSGVDPAILAAFDELAADETAIDEIYQRSANDEEFLANIIRTVEAMAEPSD